MQLDEFQERAKKYDRNWPEVKAQRAKLVVEGKEVEIRNVTEPAFVEKELGLAGEAGEVVDKLKKVVRDKDGMMNEEERREIAKELGDTLWYVAMLARYLEVPLSEVAKGNLEKLESRFQRGKLGGCGDNR